MNFVMNAHIARRWGFAVVPEGASILSLVEKSLVLLLSLDEGLLEQVGVYRRLAKDQPSH
jgi:hypothetical protein